MTRKLRISQSQITAICKGAAKAGFVAEIEINGVKITLRPETAKDDLERSLNEELEAFNRKHDQDFRL